MESGLPKSMNDHFDSTFHYSFYTCYKEMNELLNEFASAAVSEGIWISVDAHDLKENPPKPATCNIVRLALEIAKSNCIGSTAPKNRFVKIRCRNTQKKNFIKILYSCESQELRLFDKNVAKIREDIEKAGGYLKMEVVDDIGLIKIALSLS